MDLRWDPRHNQHFFWSVMYQSTFISCSSVPFKTFQCFKDITLHHNELWDKKQLVDSVFDSVGIAGFIHVHVGPCSSRFGGFLKFCFLMQYNRQLEYFTLKYFLNRWHLITETENLNTWHYRITVKSLRVILSHC